MAKSTRPKCQAQTSKCQPCKSSAIEGSSYCYVHSKAAGMGRNPAECNKPVKAPRGGKRVAFKDTPAIQVTPRKATSSITPPDSAFGTPVLTDPTIQVTPRKVTPRKTTPNPSIVDLNEPPPGIFGPKNQQDIRYYMDFTVMAKNLKRYEILMNSVKGQPKEVVDLVSLKFRKLANEHVVGLDLEWAKYIFYGLYLLTREEMMELITEAQEEVEANNRPGILSGLFG